MDLGRCWREWSVLCGCTPSRPDRKERHFLQHSCVIAAPCVQVPYAWVCTSFPDIHPSHPPRDVCTLVYEQLGRMRHEAPDILHTGWAKPGAPSSGDGRQGQASDLYVHRLGRTRCHRWYVNRIHLCPRGLPSLPHLAPFPAGTLTDGFCGLNSATYYTRTTIISHIHDFADRTYPCASPHLLPQALATDHSIASWVMYSIWPCRRTEEL